jgi:hypothetical protein
MDRQQRFALHRRGFLNGVIGGLTGGGLIAASGALVQSARAGTESDDEKRKSQYRVTDEVTTYYRVNGYPTGKHSPCSSGRQNAAPAAD